MGGFLNPLISHLFYSSNSHRLSHRFFSPLIYSHLSHLLLRLLHFIFLRFPLFSGFFSSGSLFSFLVFLFFSYVLVIFSSTGLFLFFYFFFILCHSYRSCRLMVIFFRSKFFFRS